MKKYVVSVLMLMSFSAVGAHAATVDFPCINKDGVPIPCFLGYATSVDIANLGNQVDKVNSSINDQTTQLNTLLSNMQTDSKALHQDMKNYMSLAQLDRAKADAELMLQLPPDNAVTQNNGHFEFDLKAQADMLKAYYVHEAFSRDMLSTDGKVNPNTFVDNHLTNFCSLAEEVAGLCYSKKTNRSDNAKGIDVPVDLDAQSLFKPIYKTSDIKQSDGQLSDETAAAAYMLNVTNPVPVPRLSDDQMFLNKDRRTISEDGKRNLLALYRQEALMSLAQQSLINSLTDRLAFEQKDGEGKPILDGEGKPILTSRHQLIADEATRRFNDKGWYQQMNTLSTQALLREIANMMALQLTMHERDSERLERMEALMSAQVAYLAQVIGTEEKAQQAVDKFNLKKEAEQKAGMSAGK